MVSRLELLKTSLKYSIKQILFTPANQSFCDIGPKCCSVTGETQSQHVEAVPEIKFVSELAILVKISRDAVSANLANEQQMKLPPWICSSILSLSLGLAAFLLAASGEDSCLETHLHTAIFNLKTTPFEVKKKKRKTKLN